MKEIIRTVIYFSGKKSLAPKSFFKSQLWKASENALLVNMKILRRFKKRRR